MNHYKRSCVAFGAGLALLAAMVTPAAAKAPGGRYPMLYMSVHGVSHLYVLRDAKSAALGAANSNGHDCGPAFRPDGKFVAFESNRVDPSHYEPNNFEIYALNVKTHKVKRLTNHSGWDTFPAWSPDGRRIAFSREDDPVNPVSTPIAAPRSLSIWVMNADGSGLVRLTHAARGTLQLFPAWSPDGKKIAFSATVAEVSGGVFLMNSDGSHVRQLTADGEYPAWSPDGKWIAYDSGSDAPLPHAAQTSDLYVMRADGSQQRSLGHLDKWEFFPSWSPDGKHIAYVQANVWTGSVLTLVLPGGNGVDVWQPNSETHIWELDIGHSLRVTARRQLTNGTTDLFPRYAPGLRAS